MKKKNSKPEPKELNYKNPTSIRFNPLLLTKLHAIASIRNKSVSRLVNEYVNAFVEGEYQILKMMK